MYRKTFAILLAATIPAGMAHSAFFEGQTVRMSHDWGSVRLLDPQDAVVGPGVEGTFFSSYYTVDISDAAIYITFTGPGTFDSTKFNGVHVFDLNGTIPTIGSASIAATSFENLGNSRISHDADNIFIDLGGINPTGGGGEFIRVDVSPVPEPASYLTMLVGFLVVGATTAARQRKEWLRWC